MVAAVATVRPVAEGRSADTLTLPGVVDYDPRRSRAVAARFGGRIERLPVRFNYQPVRRGQKLLEIYSPELVTAEQELHFPAWKTTPTTRPAQRRPPEAAAAGVDRQAGARPGPHPPPELPGGRIQPVRRLRGENVGRAPPAAPAGWRRSRAAWRGAARHGRSRSRRPRPGSSPATASRSGRRLREHRADPVSGDEYRRRCGAFFSPRPRAGAGCSPGQTLRVVAEGPAYRPARPASTWWSPSSGAGASAAAVRVYLPNPRGCAARPAPHRPLVTRRGQPGGSWWLPRAAVVDLGTRQVAFVRRGAHVCAGGGAGRPAHRGTQVQVLQRPAAAPKTWPPTASTWSTAKAFCKPPLRR